MDFFLYYLYTGTFISQYMHERLIFLEGGARRILSVGELVRIQQKTNI
jgi:hypothetical protein